MQSSLHGASGRGQGGHAGGHENHWHLPSTQADRDTHLVNSLPQQPHAHTQYTLQRRQGRSLTLNTVLGGHNTRVVGLLDQQAGADVRLHARIDGSLGSTQGHRSLGEGQKQPLSHHFSHPPPSHEDSWGQSTRWWEGVWEGPRSTKGDTPAAKSHEQVPLRSRTLALIQKSDSQDLSAHPRRRRDSGGKGAKGEDEEGGGRREKSSHNNGSSRKIEK